MEVSKYRLYEETVQSPNWQVDYLPQFHQWLCKKAPRHFREDFCGSAKISCEWVKRSPKNSATGLDWDPEPLSYAKKINLAALSRTQQKRVKLIQQNVLKPTKEKFDMIGAFNFSFFDFHERKDFLAYAKSVHRSLRSPGTLFLECAGGEGFIKSSEESKTVPIDGIGRVKQVWEQHQYDPITQVNDYSIHFQLPDQTWLNDSFTYHWRIWSIREIREVLMDAGFKKTVVLWNHAKDPNSAEAQFLPSEDAQHVESWQSYIIALKQ